MEKAVQTIVDYMKVELPRLRDTYRWKIPNIDGFSKSGEVTYEANVDLKKFLHKRWMSAATEEQKLELAQFVIADWGGVRGNKRDTLEGYIAEISKEEPAIPLQGVSSYSKLFSIVQPDRYSIYDARVAACLNAIQYQAEPGRGVAFNYCPGRNNQIGNVTNRSGFVYEKEFRVRSLVGSGWTRIRRDDTYRKYLQLISGCLAAFPKYKRHDFEMVLFANAEIEAVKAIAVAKKLRRP